MHDSIDLASGIAAFEAKEFRRAMQLLGPLATGGDPDAQFRVAIMLQNGLGTVADPQSAYAFMRQAAEQENGFAQHSLGFMLLHGECAAKDERAAAEWFQKAADQGLEGSMTMLATLYEQGLGVPKNIEKAKELYRRAGFDEAG